MQPKLAIVLVALAAVVSAQEHPTFRGGISLVHVDTEVMSKDGRIVAGLSGSDFRVFDDGQEQALSAFAAEEQPLDIILLFDVSGSMRTAVEKVGSAARQALHELRRGDRIAIMTFNTSSKLVTSFTDDLDSVERDIQDVVNRRFDGGTHIQQAVDDAANYFLRNARTQRRRAVLIITDNLGLRTRKEISVVRNLWEADALLSGLIVSNPMNKVRLAVVAVMAPYMLPRVGGMDKIAEKTGGDTIHSDDPASAFPEMMRRIRSRYSLYYPTPEGRPGSYRSIRVELTADAQSRYPGSRLYARRGYRLNRS